MSDRESRRPERDDRRSFRNFAPTTFAVGQRASILVLVAIIAILGLVSYRSIPKESSPSITIPMIAVSTAYPGVAPQDVETLVTRVIEEELYGISDLKELRSTSIEGYSSIIAEFETDMDMDEALQKVREKVDLARPALPADAEEPTVTEFNFAEFPIMQVNVSGEYDLVRLKEAAEELKDRLEQIPSILEVRLSGGLEREVRVDVDLPRLQFYGLAFDDVIAAIRNENVTIPGGAIDVGNQKFLVRVDGEFVDTRIIEDIVITTLGGRPIYIRDVARVDFGFRERESYARLDGNPVVTLDIVKRSGENIIETADAVKSAIAELEPTFPATTVVKITGDVSKEIHKMVSSLENNIISGLILVVAVLLFFLGVRNASLVAVSIPLSMLLSFIVMRVAGISMNMVVLFSLILALGMLVDNAIVVVENIYRFREEGYDNATAAIRATGEVALPVIGSTATTVAAFFPLVFWPGITGEFMSFLPKTVIITLTSSLFVALVIVPVLCALFMKLDGEPREPLAPSARRALFGLAGAVLLGIALGSPLAALMMGATAVALVFVHRRILDRIGRRLQDRALPAIIAGYERRLRWALRHRALVLFGSAATFVLTIVAFVFLNAGVEFFPESIPPATVYAEIHVPDGTRPAFLNRLTKQVEAQLADVPGMEDAQSVVATAGGRGANLFGGPSGDATVTVNFKDFEDRAYDVFETLRRMRERLGQGLAGADFRLSQTSMGPPAGKPVNIEIVGEDAATLRRLADRAVQILENAPVAARLDGLESDMARGRSELVVEVDREKAALYGIHTLKVGSTIRTAIQGTEAATFRTGNDEYDIVVRLAEPYRSNLDALRDLTVMTEDGRQIPLPSVATWRVDEGYGSVVRKDMDRVATVSSDVVAGANSNAVLAEVRQALAEFAGSLPAGYTIRYTGEQEEQQEAMAFLSNAFLIALMLIAFILISQFDSVIKPVIILTSVIMSTIGVLLGLMLFRMPFGIIMTGVGVISLAGVVVNNAIVLIDYVDVLRGRDGMDRREALVRAGMIRFRPVILTAVTTVLGLVPLAVGFNLDFIGLYTRLDPNLFWGGEQAAWWGPMAIAVIVGLSFATVLTLVIVPVLYSVVDDIGESFRRRFTRAVPAEAGVAASAGAATPVGAREGAVAAVALRLRRVFRLSPRGIED
ncbi:MAG TPA: efflux RND transporter permease subunit [Longimicrobiales bacterium]